MSQLAKSTLLRLEPKHKSLLQQQHQRKKKSQHPNPSLIGLLPSRSQAQDG
jgi:hypothetical protein